MTCVATRGLLVVCMSANVSSLSWQGMTLLGQGTHVGDEDSSMGNSWRAARLTTFRAITMKHAILCTGMVCLQGTWCWHKQRKAKCAQSM